MKTRLETVLKSRTIKRNKGFILLYACIVIILVFILVTMSLQYNYYTNMKVIKREEQLESFYVLDGTLVQTSTSSFKTIVGKG